MAAQNLEHSQFCTNSNLYMDSVDDEATEGETLNFTTLPEPINEEDDDDQHDVADPRAGLAAVPALPARTEISGQC